MFNNYTQLAIKFAKLSGEELKNGFNTNFIISTKSNQNDLVTEYDLKAEKIIINEIKANFPEHNILTEESGQLTNSTSEYTWIIDPLDGTVNFANGVPIFSVSIALKFNENIISGVVYNPISNELFYAEKGKGAYLNEKKIEVSKNSGILKSLLVTGFPYNISENPQNCLDTFVRVALKGMPIRRLGSAALDLCYVAAGKFDGFWEVTLKPWDIAAGMLILEEAGGKITNYQGQEHTLFEPNLIGTNSLIHNNLLKLINEN